MGGNIRQVGHDTHSPALHNKMKESGQREGYCRGRLVCQVSTGWLSQHSMADDSKKLEIKNPSTRYRSDEVFGRGVGVRSIGGGSPLLNWMPLDWLQEVLSTPPTIGCRWG